jgi:FMN phosphatase YigB (HAD superfamily)
MLLLGITLQEFDDAFARARSDVKDKLQGTASSHSRILYFQKTVELLGLGTKILLTLDLEQTYWHTFLLNTRLFPGVKDFIIQLKSDGIITANITDLTTQIQFRKMVYLGLDEYFDYVVTSEEAGKDKPHRVPFDIILSKIDVSPSEVWMIGDNPINDIKGALAVGMIPFQKVHSGVIISEELKDHKKLLFKEYVDLFEIYSSLS